MYKEALTEILTKCPLQDKGVPLVVTKEMTEDDCMKLINEAIVLLNANDYFTNPTKETLRRLGWTREDGYIKPIPKEEVKEVEIAEVEPPSMLDEINTGNLKALKDICKAEPVFKPLRGKLDSYKLDTLKMEMLNILNPVPDILITNDPQSTIQQPEIMIKEVIVKNLKDVNEIVTRPPFSNLFEVKRETLKVITDNMMTNGFDPAYPIVLWKDTCIDGHTRLRAAIAAGIDTVPIETKLFATEQDALEYSIHNQRDRRNISDADLLKCISIIDTPMSKTDASAKGGKAEGERVEPTHKITAKVLNIGESKVTDARAVLKDEEAVKEVETGEKTISKAAKDLRKKKQKPKKVVLRALSQIEAIVRLLKDNAGNEVPIVSIIEKADAIMVDQGEESNLLMFEELVNMVLEILLALNLVKVFADRIVIKKALK